MSEFKEILKLHQDPFINSSDINMQSISTSKSDGVLFANAYGKTEKEATERAKLIVCAPEMLEMLQRIEQNYDCGTETYKRILLLIKKATE